MTMNRKRISKKTNADKEWPPKSPGYKFHCPVCGSPHHGSHHHDKKPKPGPREKPSPAPPSKPKQKPPEVKPKPKPKK